MNRKKPTKTYVADLETTTKRDDCRVYTVGVMELGKEETFKHCIDLDKFFSMMHIDNSIIYFHNLKFDGQFILDWLLTSGYTWVSHQKYAEEYTFTTLIGSMNEFYNIKIWFGSGGGIPKTMELKDSLKVLPFTVEKMPKAFDMKGIKKLNENYDYHKERPIGYTIDKEEEKYLKNDVLIVSKALEYLFNHDMKKLTTASNSLHQYKKTLTKSQFKAFFPTPYYDSDIRKGYKGGFTFLNPIYKEKVVTDVSVLDVNSLYPSVMRNKLLPYGQPIEFEGEYKYDVEYPLCIQKLTCSFELKKGKIPSMQIKGDLRFNPRMYLKNSKDQKGVTQLVGLTLTNVDLDLFFEQYDVYDLQYHGGYAFKQTNTMFIKFIDHWNMVKEDSTRIVINGIVIQEGNESMRTLAKLMLNSLYGKFGTNPVGKLKFPFYDYISESVKFDFLEETERDALYLPVAMFVTAYGRDVIIRTSQTITDYSMEKYGQDKYVYSDTDSIHTTLTEKELREILNVNPTELGAWDYEDNFKFAKYLRAKSYVQTNDINDDSKLLVTCAGMSPGCYPYVTFDNFKVGTTYDGKLQAKRVSGGTILEESVFTLK